jgi:DNA-binding MarR family transcriptional regulator
METNTSTARQQQQAILAWVRLMRVYQKVSRVAATQLRECNLSLAQFDLLNHLSRDEGMTQQELADRLLVTKGNICQLLDRLEQQALLVREQEGRANRLYLTDQARRLLADILPGHEAAVAAQFAALSPAEQATLLALLRKLDQA